MTNSTAIRVGNLMSVDPIVIDADSPITEAELLLKSYRISGLPVVQDGASSGCSARPTCSTPGRASSSAPTGSASGSAT